jgi:hypothetical protein
MVNINLVPEKIRSAEALKVIVILGALSLSLPVLFWAMKYQGKRASLAAVDKEVDALNAELASPALKNIVASVEQFTKDQSDLDTKRSVVDLLRKRQVLLLRLLDALPDIIPGFGRVTSLVAADAKGAKKVTMTCEFTTLDAIAAVYENLEASPLVDRLEMVGAVETKKNAAGKPISTSTYSFNLQDLP